MRNTFFGLKIIEAPVRMEPRLKLSENCPCSDKLREEFNAWLVEMFGISDVSLVPNGMAFAFGDTIIMRPEQIAMLRNITA